MDVPVPKTGGYFSCCSFADDRYTPLFDPWIYSNYSSWSGLIFSREEVKVLCQGVPACEYDFMSSGRREDALDTLEYERKFELKKQKGEIRVQSCGPLVKSKGVLKYPSGNNYLHGITVTFSCKPEYFLHGEQQRTCVNGTWSPGWWPWCRERTEETALKWMTGILSSVAIILAIVVVFIWCAMEGRRRQRDFIRGRKMHSSLWTCAGSHISPKPSNPYASSSEELFKKGSPLIRSSPLHQSLSPAPASRNNDAPHSTSV
ncbi:hypothetical protein Y032_0570g105 [Ancylostoma ceylanicum]|uniref:Sushi domain-containing protein n=1 Tax=Ancylostoma ceylanicum TaxID=53326 RepID=A0A016WP58_9BILA|nr:hypothetical protein Y032_0570g105 [Ancylostoma ceylanicum]